MAFSLHPLQLRTTASRQLVQNWLGWAAPQGQVAILCGVMVLASALASWLSYRSASLELNVGLRAVIGLRTSLYEALQYLPLRYHDKVRSSDSSFRVAYDAQSIQSIYNGVVHSCGCGVACPWRIARGDGAAQPSPHGCFYRCSSSCLLVHPSLLQSHRCLLHA